MTDSACRQPMADVLFSRRVSARFSRASSHYHHANGLQRHVATRLASESLAYIEKYVSPSLLEIGCGSGQWMEALSRDGRHMERRFSVCCLTDISSDMVRQSRRRLHRLYGRCYHDIVCDGRRLPFNMGFDIIVMTMVLHWLAGFGDVTPVLTEILSQQLAVGGLLILAFPGVGSLSHFHALCKQGGGRGSPFSFPDAHTVDVLLSRYGQCVSSHDERKDESYAHLKGFLDHIRQWGASVPQPSWVSSMAMLRFLVSQQDKPFTADWHIHYRLMQKTS
ncbi:MAG: methyltransferase domain-containing protein [Alphaproteobacteria bacterium GM7ARS4]|nr:methyltransferase domain-containing protein [Alphaproteobacteria bacterium GM7ARS4]